MENKLQELTNKLYEEGLAKGRSDAEKMVAEAQARAAAIEKEAREQAAAIEEQARRQAEELRRNTLTEITLAGRQAVTELRERIAEMIVAKTVAPGVHAAAVDPAFIRQMLLAVAGGWRSDAAGKVTLSALLPAEWQEKFGREFEAAAGELLDEGIEVGYSDKVRSGLRMGPREGGYYISFSAEDFDALLSEFLKEKVARMLYGDK